MMLHIPGVLAPEQVKAMRERLAATDWVDGRASVGSQGAQVKRNRQLAEGSPLALELGQIVSAALAANPLFFSSALPLRILPPFFNSYAGGEHYGPHVDGAIRAQHARDVQHHRKPQNVKLAVSVAERPGATPA